MAKKNLTKLLFCVVLLTITITACDPAEQYKTELEQIDSYLSTLDSLEELYDGIEFDSLGLMLEHVLDNEATIKRIYSPDTINEELGRQMGDSKVIRKRLKNYEKDKLIYGDELNAVKHQFINLKEDVTNGVLNDDQIQEYLKVEKAALDKVSMAFEEFYNMQLGEKNRYYTVVPTVDEFIEKLKRDLEELD